MNGYRSLYASEREFLLNALKNSPSRKVMHVFMGIWKSFFIISVLGIGFSVVEAILTKDYFMLFSVFGIGITFLWFWVLPNFVLRKVDEKYNAVKNGKVFLRETPLIACRINRERTSSSSRHYRDVYYASVWNDTHTHTYDVITSRYIYEFPVGEMVGVLRYVTGNNSTSEFVVPLDFASCNREGVSLYE